MDDDLVAFEWGYPRFGCLDATLGCLGGIEGDALNGIDADIDLADLIGPGRGSAATGRS